MRAVLVDDEPLALKRLARLLRENGRVEVEASFSDPAAALAHLEQDLPDILFLDIEMPGMNGFELLGSLSEQSVSSGSSLLSRGCPKLSSSPSR